MTLDSHVVVTGRTTIGARTRIFPFASIGHPPQDVKYKGEPSTLTIGVDCRIREGVTMNCGTVGGGGITRVGDNCLFLANSHVAHDCILGNDIILSNNVMLAGHVHVGDKAILSGGCAVHQFTRIGRQAFIGGLSAVAYDVIPYGMLNGNPGLAIGNIVGSNIYNVLGILGVTAIIKPIDVPPQIASLDIWVMIAATVLLFITATSRWRIGRVEGGIMLAAYVGYCVWLGMNSAA